MSSLSRINSGEGSKIEKGPDEADKIVMPKVWWKLLQRAFDTNLPIMLEFEDFL